MLFQIIKNKNKAKKKKGKKENRKLNHQTQNRQVIKRPVYFLLFLMGEKRSTGRPEGTNADQSHRCQGARATQNHFFVQCPSSSDENPLRGSFSFLPIKGTEIRRLRRNDKENTG
jgi:hypothetical protein